MPAFRGTAHAHPTPYWHIDSVGAAQHLLALTVTVDVAGLMRL